MPRRRASELGTTRAGCGRYERRSISRRAEPAAGCRHANVGHQLVAMQLRLQKILSQAGVASRRAAETLIASGRVSVSGVTVREMGTKAAPARDDIRVDGRRVRGPERHRYILLNKPAGYVTTRSDPQRRPTVIDLLRGVREYLYPVGRLDYDTEGLLLATNAGGLG